MARRKFAVPPVSSISGILWHWRGGRRMGCFLMRGGGSTRYFDTFAETEEGHLFRVYYMTGKPPKPSSK